MSHTATDFSTLVDLLRWRAAEHPDAPVYTFLADGERETGTLTFGELDRRARALATLLTREGAADERVLLLFAPSLDFLVGLFGCMYAGAVAVPAYPPEPNRFEHTLRRLQSIVADARCDRILTTRAIAGMARTMVGATAGGPMEGARWLTLDAADDVSADDWQAPDLDARSLAFLQYTSGSTSAPKGVRVDHGSLLANLRMSQEAYGLVERGEVFVSWLPQYHDMGLVGVLLGAVNTGGRAIFMPPAAFIKRPLRWLSAIARYRGTCTASPNFGYDLCLRKVSVAERDALDLSSLRTMVNGAEPVNPETSERFIAFFEPAGFAREVFAPSYGLAETVLFVTTGERRRRPTYLEVDRDALEGHRVEAAAPGREALTLVSCGQTWSGGSVRVVDPDTRRVVPAGGVGEIWISGPHVTDGYWGKPDLTALRFGATLADTGEGPFLRTGDLGFVRDGELFVTGRLKDMLVLRGRNLYPHDLERTMDAVRAARPEVRLGCSAAVSVPVDGHEQLVVLQEVDERRLAGAGWGETVAALRRAIVEDHAVAPHAVCLLRKGTLPKTSSGKIMRSACRRAYLDGFEDAGEVVVAVERAAQERPAGPAAAIDAASPIAGWVVAWISEQTGLDAAGIALDADFPSLGLDSVDGVQFIGDLEEHLSRAIPVTVLSEHRTVGELVAHFEGGGAAA